MNTISLYDQLDKAKAEMERAATNYANTRKAFHKADAGADKFGDAVWVNGVGMLFRMPDGRYNLTPIQSGGDK